MESLLFFRGDLVPVGPLKEKVFLWVSDARRPLGVSIFLGDLMPVGPIEDGARLSAGDRDKEW